MNRYLIVLFLLAVVPVQAEFEQQFADIGDLELESGQVLRNVNVGYITAGTLNADKSNVLVFPTWFGGSARNLVDFGHIGPGKLADTDRFYVVAIDALANGVSTSPSNSVLQPGEQFPRISIGTMVESQYRLLTDVLGIEHVGIVMGISMGGMQTFDWIARYPEFMDKAVSIVGTPGMASHDLLQWNLHKDLILTMRAYGASDEDTRDLLSRLNLLTLYTPDYYAANVTKDALPGFISDLASRADFDDYVAQIDALIKFDLLADDAYAERVQAKLLVINSASDHMVTPGPGRAAAELLGARYLELDSICGHIAIGCEADTIANHVREFLE